jgi:hypothetical protein
MAKTTRTRSRARATRTTGKRLDAVKAAVQKGPSKATSYALPTHDRIAEKAYEIWLTKGCPADNEVSIWLEAEHQLSV